MKRLLLNVMPALLFALSFTACKKDKNTGGEGDVPVTPVKFPVGQPMGTAIKKTIGAAGGTLSLADGSVSLNIPAGAVNANTEFSIQPLNNTLPAGKGQSYRLLPEGTTFSKPVQLTFKYANNYHSGSLPEALFLSYQDHNTYWHVMKNTTINKTTRTLSVNTTHFSDWGIFCDFQIVSDKTSLKPGEETKLWVVTMESKKAGEGDNTDWIMGDVKKYEIADAFTYWVKDGPGKIKDLETSAIYTAPAEIPEDTVVYVETALFGVVNKKYPDRVGLDGEVILIHPLYLTSSDQFFRYTVEGQLVNCTGYLYGYNEVAKLMSFTGVQGDTSVGIVLNRIGTGAYKFQEMNEPNTAGLEFISKSKVFGTSYTQCDSPYKKIWSPGNVNLTKWDNIGGYVEGRFTGSLYYFKECALQTKTVTGEFRMKRTF